MNMPAKKGARSRPALGARLVRASRQAAAIASGEAAPGTYRVHLPDEIDARAIRLRKGLSQSEFARSFGVPRRTLQDWEQGRRIPDATSRAFLRVIDREPAAVKRALAG